MTPIPLSMPSTEEMVYEDEDLIDALEETEREDDNRDLESLNERLEEEENEAGDEEEGRNNEEIQQMAPRKSSRVTKQPTWMSDFVNPQS